MPSTASLLDMLVYQSPTPQDRLQQIMPFLQGSLQRRTPSVSGSAPYTQGVSTTEGGTVYPYTEYDKPYYGPPPDMMTRSGFSLQPGAMRSLIDIARQSDIMKGARELSMIGGGYRPTNPTLATGMSYHQQGLAFDSSWWSQHPELRKLLEQYGWNWGQGFGDYPHWSYGVYG